MRGQRILRWLGLALLIIFLLGALGLVGWATVRRQQATERAVAVLRENDITLEDGLLVFEPDTPTDRGLIYYPGGLVDPEAYAVTAQGIADAGTLVVVPKMPLNLAFFDSNRADAIRADFPEIESWVIGGHSLGGAMAAQYAQNHTEDLDGLILFASYPADNAEFIDFPLPILTIIGSSDPGSTRQTAFYDALGGAAERAIIEGGNHRQYADYPFQAADGVPQISAAEQQAQIVEAAVQFLAALE